MIPDSYPEKIEVNAFFCGAENIIFEYNIRMFSGRIILATHSYLLGSVTHFRTILFFLFVLPFFCSCVTPIPQSRIDISLTKEIPMGEAVVFGQVKVTKDGKILSWKPDPKVISIGAYRFWPDFFTVFIKEETTNKEFVCRLVGDGSFYWHLPAGAYSMTGYHYIIGSANVESHFPPQLTPTFVISKGDSADYIGALSIEVHPIGNDVMRIDDEYDRAVRDLKSELPVMISKSKKGLMAFQ